MKEKEKNFISAVIYVCDCESNITAFLALLQRVFDENFEKYEIICVNDSSVDTSVDNIKSFVSEIGCENIFRIVNMSYYQGPEAAMRAGVDISIGDFVYEFDGTVIDYPPEMIMEIYSQALKGFDIVSAGNKNLKFSSAMFYRLFNAAANMQYKISTEAFRILSRRAINRIYAMSRVIPYRKAVYANCGLKSDALIYSGNSSDKQAKNIKYRYDTAISALIIFTNVTTKIAIAMALIMMAVTLAGVIYIFAVYAFGQPVPGYVTTILVMTGGFFALFAILAIVIKYLSVLIDLVFKEMKYIVESVEKL